LKKNIYGGYHLKRFLKPLNRPKKPYFFPKKQLGIQEYKGNKQKNLILVLKFSFFHKNMHLAETTKNPRT
jgi:hypothetical protein